MFKIMQKKDERIERGRNTQRSKREKKEARKRGRNTARSLGGVSHLSVLI
jgi:hypothetical protein